MVLSLFKRVKHITGQIPRWSKYLIGKSELHPLILKTTNPSTDHEVRDYICDFSPKSSWIGMPDKKGVPRNKLYDGELVYFPIGIIQKLLGNLELGKPLEDSMHLVEWICQSIDNNNSIPTWQHAKERTTSVYSAMTQGQALSALIRVNKIAPSENVAFAIQQLCNGFMDGEALDISLDTPNGIKLIETPDNLSSVILNGWIYALWGMKEAAITTKRSDISELADNTINCLARTLPEFYDKTWSFYDDKGRIASPFYHRLHITQLFALYKMTGIAIFKSTTQLLTDQHNSSFLKSRAVVKKGMQKISEKPYREFIG